MQDFKEDFGEILVWSYDLDNIGEDRDENFY